MVTESKKELIAFHGDKKIRAKYLKRLTLHYNADEIIQGQGWENGKGCMIGCTFNKYNHSLFESKLGLPEELAHLVDKIFEGLPNDQAKEFPLQFYKAINIGADLSKVATKFKIYLLTDKNNGVINNIKKGESYSDECINAIQVVSDLLNKSLFEVINESAWSAAWSAASSAAWSAAGTAALSAAEWAASSASRVAAGAAAWSAAKSAAWSAAESAAGAAASSASSSAAKSAAYLKMKDKLIELVSLEK